MFNKLSIGISSVILASSAAFAMQNPPTTETTKLATTCAEEPSCNENVPVAEISLLVFYDPSEERRLYGSPTTYFQGWVNQINDMYANSGVGLRMNLAGVEAYDPITGKETTAAEKLRSVRNDTYVNKRRDALSADFVTLIKRPGSNFCGYGFTGGVASTAYTISALHCGAIVLAHEMGHNMGLQHSRKQGDKGGTRYRYGLGYGVDNSFGTIMSYYEVFNGREIARFSNPNLTCRGHSCGIEAGQPDEAYAVKAMNNDRYRFRDFRVPNNTHSLSNTSDSLASEASFLLKNSGSDKCMSMEDGQLFQQTCQDENSNLAWRAVKIDSINDIYQLQTMDGKCLSLPENENFNGSRLNAVSCQDDDTQKWQVKQNSNGEYMIKSVATSRFIEVRGASKDDGAVIDQWNYYNGPNQRWEIVTSVAKSVGPNLEEFAQVSFR